MKPAPEDLPIAFTSASARAIIDGQKTQTVRPAKQIRAPYQAGNKLWVREDFQRDRRGLITFCADCYRENVPVSPGYYLRRADARLFLRVEEISLISLSEITPDDIRAEGIRFETDAEGRRRFEWAWEDNNKLDYDPATRAWKIKFSRIRQ